MDMPTTLNDALDALAAAKADLGALNSLSAEHSALVAQHDALSGRCAELETVLARSEARALELAKQLDAKAAAETEAAAKANAIVANLGVEPVAVLPEAQTLPKTKAELWAHYMTLGFVERNDFYRANQAVMSGR